MTIIDNAMLWRQYAVAIDALGAALRDCPDALWERRLWEDEPGQWVAPGFGAFWYLGYHALFWLDLYLTGSEEGFTPPAPFLLVEQDENGPLPEQPYTKAELISYLGECRKRCQATIESMTDEAAQRRCRFGWGEVSFAELLLYNMRHVAGHAAQLNLLLGQNIGSAPGWVTQAGN